MYHLPNAKQQHVEFQLFLRIHFITFTELQIGLITHWLSFCATHFYQRKCYRCHNKKEPWVLPICWYTANILIHLGNRIYDIVFVIWHMCVIMNLSHLLQLTLNTEMIEFSKGKINMRSIAIYIVHVHVFMELIIFWTCIGRQSLWCHTTIIIDLDVWM